MSNPAADQSATTSEAPDPSILRAERRLRLLEELAEIGMELVRALKPRAEAAETAGGKDPADAFAPLSRAIRLTLALEAKIDAELRDLKAGVVRTRAEKPVQPAGRARFASHIPARDPRKDRIFNLVLVLDVAEAECGDSDPFFGRLKARLLEHGEYGDCGERPLRETVERLCNDLGLSPDWDCWGGEGWDEDYAPERSRYSPFNDPRARPLLE